MLLASTAFIVMMPAAENAKRMPTTTGKTAETRVRPKRPNWLRRICGAEVGFGMWLSSVGTPAARHPAPK